MTDLTPDLIRELRHRRGWKRYQLARVLGVDDWSVWKWELGEIQPNGKNSANILRLLAETET